MRSNTLRTTLKYVLDFTSVTGQWYSTLLSPSLSAFGNGAALKLLYQEYKFNWYTVTLIPWNNISASGSTAVPLSGWHYLARDVINAGAPPASENQFLEYSGAKMSLATRPITIRVSRPTPVLQPDTVRLALRCWIPTENDGVSHSYVYFARSFPNATTTVVSYKALIRANISFRFMQ